MTFCTQCGTENDLVSRYCRECGKRLDATDPKASDLIIPAPAPEESVGDILYEGFQLNEAGDLDGAIARCREVLALSPHSSSAHTLLSMVYEKRGKTEEKDGYMEAAQTSFRLAISEREQVLKLSPGSVVDSEKLKELKRKLNPDAKRLPDFRLLPILVKTAISKVPLPILLSGGTVLVVFMITLSVMGGGGQKKQTAQNVIVSSRPQLAQGTPNQQYAPDLQQPIIPGGDEQEEDSSGDDTMNFIAPDEQETGKAQRSPTTAPPITGIPSQPVPKMDPPVVKFPDGKLDPLPNVEVVPIEPPEKPAQANPPAPTKPSQQKDPEISIQIEKGGEDHQRDAIRLYNEGKKNEAADAFRRAIDAYSSQAQKGANADSANAGIRTCKAYLQLLQQ